MGTFLPYINEHVSIELQGRQSLDGILLFVGVDVVILFALGQYLYISQEHICSFEIKKSPAISQITQGNTDDKKSLADTITASLNTFFSPITIKEGITLLKDENSPFSLKTALENAKDNYIGIFINPRLQYYGCVVEVKEDYVIFYSIELQKSVYIPLYHVKFIFVQQNTSTPFGLDKDVLIEKVQLNVSFPNTFLQLITSFSKSFIYLDNFSSTYVKSVQGKFLECCTKENNDTYYHINHIKVVQLP